MPVNNWDSGALLESLFHEGNRKAKKIGHSFRYGLKSGVGDSFRKINKHATITEYIQLEYDM